MPLQRARQIPHTSAATRRAEPLRRAPAPAPSAPSFAERSAPDDRLAGTLARAVQRRRPTGTAPPGLLQRAIIALDGPTDDPTAKTITDNCLANLQTKPARGRADGPEEVGEIKPPPLGKHESLYILGHGNTDEVADLKPKQLGAAIVGWYGGQAYRGKIKLVCCSSGVKPRGLWAKSYAKRLTSYLASNATTTFRPSSVDGVLGVAWVDENTSKIQAISDEAYDRQNDRKAGSVEKAFALDDPAERSKKLGKYFGPSTTTGKDKAKVRYYTNLPDQVPSTTWSLTRVLRRLVPCIP